MSVVPRETVAKIQFFEDHSAPWTANAVAIGTTAAEVTDLDTKTAAARAAYDAQQAAQEAAKAATETLRQAVLAMAVAGSAIIDKVRAKAKISGPSVYPLAQIPAPVVPGPTPPPGKPTEMVVTLDATGALKLKWKCPNPPGAGGTIYQLWRRIGAAGEFVYIGGTGNKSFIDATLPAGSSQVTYQLQAVRSTAVGEWAQFNVNFGVGSGGTMSASVTEATPAKIAA